MSNRYKTLSSTKSTTSTCADKPDLPKVVQSGCIKISPSAQKSSSRRPAARTRLTPNTGYKNKNTKKKNSNVNKSQNVGKRIQAQKNQNKSSRQAERDAYNHGTGPKLPRNYEKGSLRNLTRKEKQMDDPDIIENRLKEKSPWYKSIRNPLHGADVKIPDITGLETGVLQTVERFTITSTTGVTGFRVHTPYINSSIAGTAVGDNFQYVPSGATLNTISWTGPGTDTSIPSAAKDAIQGYAQSHRVVSAAIYVESLASLSTNSGEIVTFYNPFNISAFTASSVYDDYKNSFGSSVVPINSGEAVCVRWTPVSVETRTYFEFIDPNLTGTGTAEDRVPQWPFGVVIDGAPDVEYNVITVINYEFIPLYNAVDILGAEPSPVDVEEESLVGVWVENDSPSSAISPKVLAEAPRPVDINHGEDDPSGFGMFFNVVSELAPLALELLL